jgi:hypothetical protein
MTYVDLFLIIFAVAFLWFAHLRFEAVEKKLIAIAAESNKAVEIKAIELRLKISDEDGNHFSSSLTYSAQELEAARIEKWLSQRGLMMQPKGKDFQINR